MKGRLQFRLIVILVVLLVSVVASAPTLHFGWLFAPLFGEKYLDYKLTLGLDLQGGIDLVYQVKSKDPASLESDITKAVEILRNRIDQMGLANVSIQRQGKDQIRIQIPGIGEKEQKRLKRIIDTTDMLTFHLVRPNGESTDYMELEERAGPDDIILPLVEDPKHPERRAWFLLKKEPELKGDSLRHARIAFDSIRSEPKIEMECNEKGRKRLAKVTSELVGKRLAIVLAGRVYMAPVIKEPITHGRAEITGRFDVEEAKLVTSILKAGALPAPLKKLAENTVGPTLGEESVKSGISAALIGLVLVLLYMWWWYRISGLLADFAMVMNLFMVTALLLFLRATLTLPGIAGLILTIGMSVDANVIIFERIKEELANGKTVRASIEAGFEKAFTTILDSNLTTLLTAVVLYVLGSGAIRGFAVTLSIGILCSMFTALFVVRTLMELMFSEKSSISI